MGDVIVSEDTTLLQLALQTNVSGSKLAALNEIANASVALSVGSDIIVDADGSHSNTLWHSPDVREGDSVLVDWTGDGRNIIMGTVVAIALRRELIRVAADKATCSFTKCATRWFALQSIFNGHSFEKNRHGAHEELLGL